MSIIGTIEKRMALGPLDDSWYYPGGFFFGGSPGPQTKAGSAVSEQTALRLAVVWCCVRILSEDSASLPLHLYRRLQGGGKERATDHPLYSLLHDTPNPEMMALAFREALLAHVLTWGNGYAEIVRGNGTVGSSIVQALWPITPNRVTVKRNDRREVYYRISMAGTNLPDVDLRRSQVLHVPGLSFNGLVGYSPIGAAREAIGLGMSLEEFAARYFGEGAHPTGVLEHPGQVKDVGALRAATNEVYGGLSKSHRLMLLEEGMKFSPISIKPEESQFIESRKFQNIDIGTRIYRLPPQMYGEYDKASTYASAEQFSIDYAGKTLRAWLVRLEQSFNMALLSPAERSQFFFEHLMDALVRGDIKTRYDAYAVGRINGWLNADEIREFENQNPQPGGTGKIYLVQGAMIPVSQAGKNPIPALPPQAPARILSRAGIESAYVRLFADAIGRVTRKEAQRVAWLRKNSGDIDEFWRELPVYIRRQALPVFQSFAEALMALEGESRGINFNGASSEAARFAGLYVDRFAAEYLDASRALAESGADWTERDAETIAAPLAAHMAEAFLRHLDAFLLRAGAPA